MQYVMVGTRLGFRVWSEGDLALAISLWGDPNDGVYHWILYGDDHTSVEVD